MSVHTLYKLAEILSNVCLHHQFLLMSCLKSTIEVSQLKNNVFHLVVSDSDAVLLSATSYCDCFL